VHFIILFHARKVRSINSESSRQICVLAIGPQERADGQKGAIRIGLEPGSS
jgi:hypothetical protein